MRDTDTEQWRPTGFPGYWVSSLGRIGRELRAGVVRLVTLIPPHPHGPRFDRVAFPIPGRHTPKTRKVDELVMEAFVGPREDDQKILHRNHDLRDNRLANLEYAPHQVVRQALNLWTTMAKGEQHHRAKFTARDVLAIYWATDPETAQGAIAVQYRVHDQPVTRQALARYYGVSATTIHNIARHRTWTHVWVAVEAGLYREYHES